MSESDTPATPPSLGQLAKHALVFGGMSGALAIIWFLLIERRYIGVDTGGLLNWFLVVAKLAFPIGGITFGVVRWRDSMMDGSMRFAQAFGAGLAIGLAFALVQGLFYGAFTSTNPVFVDRIIEINTEHLRESGHTDEEVADEIEAMREYATPTTVGIAQTAQWLMSSLVISLLAALFVRKRVGASPPD